MSTQELNIEEMQTRAKLTGDLADTLESFMHLKNENAELRKQLQEQKATIDQYKKQETTYQRLLSTGKYS